MTTIAWLGPTEYPTQLPIEGFDVTQIKVDYATTIVFGDGSEMRLETPYNLDAGEGEPQSIDPSKDPVRSAPVLGILHSVVEVAELHESGSVKLQFGSGHRIFLASDNDFESWVFNGAGGELLVAMPGGGLTFWPASISSTTQENDS